MNQPEPSVVLEVRGVSKSFGGLKAVNSVDLRVRKGEIVSVIGPNGAGKTTFFNLLTGIYAPDEGSILLDGMDITGCKVEKAAVLGLGRTFQNIRLFGSMTVLDNVMAARHNHIKTSYLSAAFRLPGFRKKEEKAKERCRELLSLLNLEASAGELAKNLAYGRQRRLEIARALALEPKVLLLDEPAAGMNPQETEDLQKLIMSLRKNLGITIVLIEHDMAMVMGLSDRITVLEYGSRIAEGLPQEIRSNARVIEAYLGRGAASGLHPDHPHGGPHHA